MKRILVYTVRNHKNHLAQLRKSLSLVRDNLIPFTPELDMLFFCDDGALETVRWILDDLGITNHADIRKFTCGMPSYPAEVMRGIVGDKSYNNMCRFWAGIIFRDDAVSEYDYYMRLDCDSFITEPVGRDLFQELENSKAVYGYLTDAVMHDDSPHSKDLNATIKQFQDSYKGKLRGSIDDVREGMLYYTNFEVCKIQSFLLSAYMDLFDHLDRNGGIYVHRWGDHIIRYAGLHMFFRPEDVFEFKGIGYTHQTYVLEHGIRKV